MTTKTQISNWLKRARPDDTHMIVVCDTFDYSDYPVFVSGNKKASTCILRQEKL